MNENIEKTLDFIENKFNSSKVFAENDEQKNYRLQHIIRVANIGKHIAKNEGFNSETLVIGCLLHDVSYYTGFTSEEEWRNHGRTSAKIARPFLEELGFKKSTIDALCYGIAIHVDGKSDFPGEETAFAVSISDSDNIDRFDAYRIFDNLQSINFNKMSLNQKLQVIDNTLEKLYKLSNVKLATNTATIMFRDKVNFQKQFFQRLKSQFEKSSLKEKR